MAMSERAASPAAPIGNLIAAIATIAAADIAFGLTFPLLSILMETRGVDAGIIGFNTAMGPLGVFVAGPFIPGLARRVGPKRLAMLAILGCMLVLIGFHLFPSLPAWFALRFAYGALVGTLFTLSEAWIISFAEGPRRGLIMGIYTMVLSITFALGPVMLPFVDIESATPWIIGCCGLSLALLPLFFLAPVTPDENGGAASTLAFARRAPLLLFAVATCTMFDAVMLAFFPIYGLRHGLPLSSASFVLAVAVAGNAVLQIPVGMLCDRFSALKVMLAACLVTILLAAALPWAISNFWIWPLAFFFGTAAYSIYTAALAILGQHLQGEELMAGSAAFASMWGTGGIIGPSLAGLMVDGFGIGMVPLFFILIYGLLIAGLALARGQLVRRPA